MNMAGIELHNIRKHYLAEGAPMEVLKGVSLSIPENQITVILGRSGCGKTTLLRLTGGLEQPDCGSIDYGEGRKTAFVFQEPRLMPWLDVTGNISFGLKKHAKNPEQLQRIIETVSLNGFEHAYPHQLSGGMQQRCAIARALAYQPSFILMDEPFAALDHFTREQMQQELKNVQRKQKCSILFVTHSIDEALILGHKIVVIRNGMIQKEYQLDESDQKRNLLDESYISLKRDIINNLNLEGANHE